MKIKLLNLLIQQNTGYSSIYIKIRKLENATNKKQNLLLEVKDLIYIYKKNKYNKNKGIILNNLKNKFKVPKLIIESSKYEIT